MALTPRLDLRQAQTLVMTPQLQQAIKLLQLSNLELTAYVEQELERNPLLERDDGERDGATANEAENDPGDTPPSDDPLRSVDLAVGNESAVLNDNALDVDYENVFDRDLSGGDGAQAAMAPDAMGGQWNSRGGSFDDGEANLENTLADRVSLRDHLAGQISVDFGSPAERLVGSYMIDLLDEAGYFTGDIGGLARALGCGTDVVEGILSRLQQLDPPGIFARSLAECLALQLRDRDRLDPAMQAMLDNLDLLARHDVDALVRVCGVDAEDIADMVAEIRALNPKPALAFDTSVAEPVTPDVIMRPHPSGGWIVELNNETLPRVLVDNLYYTTVNRVARNKEDKQYLNECLQSANWLVRSLHQRATTILKVATEIVRQQETFFAQGVQALRPLVLRDIAQVIDMHESTVSRVTSNKFIATPRGIFELKYFFTQAIASSAGGEAHSAESVRHRIRGLIDGETPDAVLSDDAIVEVLRDEGVDIARRTVAKYREAMGIPSSVRRRREKAHRL